MLDRIGEMRLNSVQEIGCDTEIINVLQFTLHFLPVPASFDSGSVHS